jgi:hypothetical protein
LNFKIIRNFPQGDSAIYFDYEELFSSDERIRIPFFILLWSQNIFPFVRCGTTKNYSISLMIAEIELWLMQEAQQRVHQEQKLKVNV